MLRSEKVATPFTAVTVLVPESVPRSRRPPLCPIAIVTEPLKDVIVFNGSATTVTRTGFIVSRGSVVLGCVVNTRCAAVGLRASTVASQVLCVLELKYQVHCGSTGAPSLETSYSPSTIIEVLLAELICVNPDGRSKPVTPLLSVTA